jgi:hypothetical protein
LSFEVLADDDDAVTGISLFSDHESGGVGKIGWKVYNVQPIRLGV